jgi:hypothetical protein
VGTFKIVDIGRLKEGARTLRNGAARVFDAAPGRSTAFLPGLPRPFGLYRRLPAEFLILLVQLGGYCQCPASALINLENLLAGDLLL